MLNDLDGLMKAFARNIANDHSTESMIFVSATRVQVTLPENEIQRMLVLAQLCSSVKLAIVKTILRFGMVAFDAVKRHSRYLFSGSPIIQSTQSVMCFALHQVVEAVECIISPQIMKSMFQGTRIMMIDGREV